MYLSNVSLPVEMLDRILDLPPSARVVAAHTNDQHIVVLTVASINEPPQNVSINNDRTQDIGDAYRFPDKYPDNSRSQVISGDSTHRAPLAPCSTDAEDFRANMLKLDPNLEDLAESQ